VHAPLAAPNVADIAAPATKQTDMDSPFNRGGTPSTSAAVSTACALAETARDPPAARMPNLEGVSSEVVVSDDSTANGVSEVKQEDPTPPPAVPASATEQGDTTNAPETKTAPVVATDTAKEGGDKKQTKETKWTVWEDEQFFKALKTVGPNFEKIAEMIGTRNKSQVRTFHNAEVKKINAVLAPLGVQVDPLDAEEVHTAMESWHSMKDRLGPGAVTAKGVLSGKRDTERNRLAWEFKNELDKSVWTEGKRRAKLRALGVLGEHETTKGGNGVLGVVVGDGGAVKHAQRGRPKGSKNKPGGSPGSRSAKGAGGRARNDPSRDASKPTERKGGVKLGDEGVSLGAKKSKADRDARRRGAAGDGGDDPSRARLMLQLFAVDDVTKSALLAAGLNPHLELTFRAKKSVPGLMQHLAVKWAAAIAKLPKTLRDAEPTLQLYPFESASAAEAKGAWNASHDGATATDIFDACGRPAMFRVRYGWVPGAVAAARPYLAPPPPPVHQDSVVGGGGRRDGRRAGTPPENLSPRKRAAEEMHVAHDSFCHEPVNAGMSGAFLSHGVMFAGGAATAPGFGFQHAAGHGSIFGADLAGSLLFGEPTPTNDFKVGAGTHANARSGSAQHGVDRAIDRPAAVALPSSGDFTLSGFADPREFSNMCREMGLEDPSASGRDEGVAGAAAPVGSLDDSRVRKGSKQEPREAGEGDAFASAAPGELSDRARREVLAEFATGAGDASVTVGGMLDNDMFSLTRMLGDVPAEGATRDGAHLGTHAGGDGGPTSFAGMFSGNLADAMGAKPTR